MTYMSGEVLSQSVNESYIIPCCDWPRPKNRVNRMRVHKPSKIHVDMSWTHI